MTEEPGVEWWAACEGLYRIGPFVSAEDAWESVSVDIGEDLRSLYPNHLPGAYVWPERKATK